MSTGRKPLLFRDVDKISFSMAYGESRDERLDSIYAPARLGPLLELMHLYVGGRLPDATKWLVPGSAAPLVRALEQGSESWSSSTNRHAGLMRSTRQVGNHNLQFTGFLMDAKRAGVEVGCLSKPVSGQLVAAMAELESNIHEHSDAPETGIVAYRAEPGAFEFVVADSGVGILNSLRRHVDYSSLQDEGAALEVALTDGQSRFGPSSNRGHGFRPIFNGLVNLYGELRFRSGDQAIVMDGTSPELATSRLSQKVPLDGFFASVRCHATRS